MITPTRITPNRVRSESLATETQRHGERRAMKRPALVVTTNVVQALLGFAMAGMTGYLIILSRWRETREGVDPAGGAHGLQIGAVVFAIPAVITLLGAAGLWKCRFWGWVLSLATDVGILATLIYGMVDDNEIDTEMLILTAGFVMPIVLLLLPSVRKFFVTSSRVAQTA